MNALLVKLIISAVFESIRLYLELSGKDSITKEDLDRVGAALKIDLAEMNRIKEKWASESSNP